MYCRAPYTCELGNIHGSPPPPPPSPTHPWRDWTTFVNNPPLTIESCISVDALCMQIPYNTYLPKCAFLLPTMKFLLEMPWHITRPIRNLSQCGKLSCSSVCTKGHSSIDSITKRSQLLPLVGRISCLQTSNSQR
jgi:hypothetical protein